MVTIYAEKASVARSIAQALDAGKRIYNGDEPTIGHWEFKLNNEDAILCHGSGHIAGLCNPSLYDEKYKKWDLDIYPCIPNEYMIEPTEQGSKVLEYIKPFFKKSDWFINATDYDREGELIFDYIYRLCECNQRWFKLKTSDLSKKTLLREMNCLTKDEDMKSVVMAGRSRAIADWLLGINLTIATTKKIGGNIKNNLMSIGRVQTPILSLITKREEEIKTHQKEKYYKVFGEFKNIKGETILTQLDCKEDLTEEKEVADIIEFCKGKNGVVIEKKTKETFIKPPLLYNATDLQIAVNRIYGFAPTLTAEIMQSLYEKKLITYPRTNSKHLPEDMQQEVRGVIKHLFENFYKEYSIPETSWNNYNTRYFDKSKVDSHTALIPTDVIPVDLTDEEIAVYDLIAKSCMRIVYPEIKNQESYITIDVEGVGFAVKLTKTLGRGWSIISNIEDKRSAINQENIDINEGDVLKGEYYFTEKNTEPPARYTIASLLKTMENPSKFIDNEYDRKLMRVERIGLGTSATRPYIIDTLINREYICLRGKSVFPTEKGKFLIESFPIKELKEVKLTLEWEKRLDNILKGYENYDSFILDMQNTTVSWFNIIKSTDRKFFIPEKDKKYLCPICKEPLSLKAWGWGCTGFNNGCKFSVSKVIAKTEVTEEILSELLSTGRTKKIKFKSKANADFKASLKINEEKQAVVFDFD